MKKYLWLTIAVVGVVLMVMSCSTRDHKAGSQVTQEKEMITWEKLDTFVFDNPAYKVLYPDNFVPDSSLLDNRNMRFDYSFAGYEVFLKCFSYPNDANMTDSAAVEFSVGLRKINEDSITLVDKHPGYFYLEGMDGYYKFYEQYVVDKNYICVLGLFYSPELGEEKVKNLKALVHEWSPK
ncbi:hypothetical protein [Prevotella sp. P6B1]|uniref:hypothetical protein n=1 Tax=Prevotella sp. P6B1 TaxID=1410613 RepID=UPI00051AE1CD|nr:hypothetical protein [Prevotella sp. P6B1]